MHKTNCMQSIEQISTLEVFSSICPYQVILFGIIEIYTYYDQMISNRLINERRVESRA